MERLLIYKLDNTTRAIKAHVGGERFVLNQEKFRNDASLGDYDLLRDNSGQLVGFAFNGFESAIDTLTKVLGANAKLEIAANSVGVGFRLVFLVSPCHEWKEIPVQASSCIYHGNRGGVIIGLDQWVDFGPTRFSLDEVDKSVFD